MTSDRVNTLGARVGPALILTALVSVAVVLLAADPAAAHPGGSGGDAVDGILHPLSGLDHLLAAVAVGVIAATARSTRAAWSVAASLLAGVLFGVVLGLAGVAVAGDELMIAGSVVALGALVAFASPSSRLWMAPLVFAWGVVHGLAHGAEAPRQVSPVLYVAGLLAATAALVVAGAAVGVRLRGAPAARLALGAGISATGLALVVGL